MNVGGVDPRIFLPLGFAKKEEEKKEERKVQVQPVPPDRVSFYELLGLLLVGLKLSGQADLPWWVVLLPLYKQAWGLARFATIVVGTIVLSVKGLVAFATKKKGGERWKRLTEKWRKRWRSRE